MSYPIELNLAGCDVVVIGGGPVAARKVAGLLEAGAKVRVISLDFVPEMRQLSDIQLVTAAYTPEVIGSARLVFACTDDRETNARIAADARTAGCWCNVADDPEASDFFVPAVLRRGQLTVSVGTAGAAPRLAASLRDTLESHFGPELCILVDELQRARRIVRRRVAEPRLRRRILATLAAGESVELLKSQGVTQFRAWVENVIDQNLAGDQQDGTNPG